MTRGEKIAALVIILVAIAIFLAAMFADNIRVKELPNGWQKSRANLHQR